MKHELIGSGVHHDGRRYNGAARRRVARAAQGKYVFDLLPDGTKMPEAAHIMGEVGESVLEDDGRVMVEVKPLTDIGKVLVRELEAGQARLFMRGRGNPEKVEGVDVVGEDYELDAVGIEAIPLEGKG